MKLIRMTRTMAGPAGSWHPGQTRTVEDAEADALIAADAAELIAVIPVEETAVVTKPKRNKKVPTE